MAYYTEVFIIRRFKITQFHTQHRNNIRRTEIRRTKLRHVTCHDLMVEPCCVSLCVSLQWRHDGRDRVSNHQPHDCLLSRLFRRRSKKTSKLRVTGLCAGNSPGTGEFPAQMTSNAENVSIWWRHHVVYTNGSYSCLSGWLYILTLLIFLNIEMAELIIFTHGSKYVLDIFRKKKTTVIIFNFPVLKHI